LFLHLLFSHRYGCFIEQIPYKSEEERYFLSFDAMMNQKIESNFLTQLSSIVKADVTPLSASFSSTNEPVPAYCKEFGFGLAFPNQRCLFRNFSDAMLDTTEVSLQYHFQKFVFKKEYNI
jgi:hypothetical protein